MTFIRISLLAALLAVSGCSSSQVAAMFRGWCHSADNCDDHSRRPQ